MYFLEKLCRICVQTGVPLVNIDTVDFDLIRLSEKLEICANLTISKDTVSSEICEKCVNKLRVSYHFLDMCKKSTKIIQGYLAKLICTEESQNSCQNVDIAELNVEIDKLAEYETDHLDCDDLDNCNEISKENMLILDGIGLKHSTLKRKQRITKEQRCSLLKKLLNRPKKERDKLSYCQNIYDYQKGGLKNIIDFTKNYEFSFNLDKNSNIESTPLDKLTAFSTNYFRRDFTEFKTHILYVIENRHNFDCFSAIGSDEEDYMSESERGYHSDGSREVNFEEVVVEPDIKIKNEAMDCEEESQCPLDYLETSFEEEDGEVEVKKEDHSESENEEVTDRISASHDISNLSSHTSKSNDEISPWKSLEIKDIDTKMSLNYKSSLSINSSPAVKLLDRLVSSYPMSSRRVFSSSNVRCRTRDHPYINPLLKNQFLYRSFKCERCNRYFKSQGYLKAHTSKVH